MTMERAIQLYDRLSTADPVHASPLEHVAMADEWIANAAKTWEQRGHPLGFYHHERDHRNFVGFRQLRAFVERGEQF